MNDAERKALLGICLVAAYADGDRSEVERELIQRTGAGLDLGPFDVPEFYEHAETGLLSVEALVGSLATRDNRLLAYEMALGVCEADGEINAAERGFLEELQGLLQLDAGTIAASQAATRKLLGQIVAAVPPPPPDTGFPTPPVAGPERLILEHAILCGALERMPEALAALAVLPTQMKLVRLLGQVHGIDLDRGEIKAFFQDTGAGLASQTVGGYANRLARGFLGRVLGDGRPAPGPDAPVKPTAFTTAYALGQVAERYLAGGRKLTAKELRAAFEEARGQAREVEARYAAEIEACRRDVRVQNLLPARGVAP